MLYSSNAFWAASGYGVQGKSLLPRLAELPEFGGRENIAQFAWYGLQGGVHNVMGFRVYPVSQDAYGNDVVGAHTRHFQANLVVTLIDAWVLHNTAEKVKPALWCPWLPIDHDPVPQRVLDAREGAYMPITYAKWGHEMLSKEGVENIYIPHGIETDQYYVERDREAIRKFRQKMFGAECDHLTVMVAANKGYPDRKAFQFQLRAWANFAKDKPNARLYIHTEPTDMFGGIVFPELTNRIGITDKVIFPDRYQYHRGFPETFMRLMYNSADMFLGATMSEGFGIPIIEAQACGTPVIVTDFSAMPELVRWGTATEMADLWWSPMNSWQAIPSVANITNALHDYYEQWQDAGADWPIERRIEAQDAIHSEYSWDVIVADQWAPLMQQIGNAVTPWQSAWTSNGDGLQRIEVETETQPDKVPA
jgi:glycosyltransferase involved in cell wall biosynthesis